jgi:hypothetical protein
MDNSKAGNEFGELRESQLTRHNCALAESDMAHGVAPVLQPDGAVLWACHHANDVFLVMRFFFGQVNPQILDMDDFLVLCRDTNLFELLSG